MKRQLILTAVGIVTIMAATFVYRLVIGNGMSEEELNAEGLGLCLMVFLIWVCVWIVKLAKAQIATQKNTAQIVESLNKPK